MWESNAAWNEKFATSTTFVLWYLVYWIRGAIIDLFTGVLHNEVSLNARRREETATLSGSVCSLLCWKTVLRKQLEFKGFNSLLHYSMIVIQEIFVEYMQLRMKQKVGKNYVVDISVEVGIAELCDEIGLWFLFYHEL